MAIDCIIGHIFDWYTHRLLSYNITILIVIAKHALKRAASNHDDEMDDREEKIARMHAGTNTYEKHSRN